MSKMIRVEEAVLRADDVSHMKWDRGYSYTNLTITMRDGHQYVVRDHNGSAYNAERAILDAIEDPRP